LIDGEVGVFDEGNRFVWCFGGEDVAEGNVLEAKILADIVVVGDIDTGRNTVQTSVYVIEQGNRSRRDIQRTNRASRALMFLI
jgi:hypothetical protein